MSQTDNILEELGELNSALGSYRNNPYQVPEGYFAQLATNIMLRIKVMEAKTVREELEILSPFLSGVSKRMPYEVPTGYFEQLDSSFVTIDADKEIESLSPLLSGIRNKNPYKVPAGYFDEIEIPVAKKRTAKVINFGWVRFAAAAVITGLIVMAAFYFRSEKQAGLKVMAKITRDVKKMDETQKDNLLDFMDAGMSGEETTQVSADTKSTIKNLIQEVTEEELKDFQEQTEDIQNVLMTN